jgi:TonB family protein
MRNWSSRVVLVAFLFWGLSSARSQDHGSQPVVVGLDVPVYPPVAVSARLEGTVLISVFVSNGVVQKAEVNDGAQPLLAAAAKRNVLSWRFTPETTRSVTVRFTFELAKTEVILPQNLEIQMRLPEFVKVIAKPVKPLTVY